VKKIGDVFEGVPPGKGMALRQPLRPSFSRNGKRIAGDALAAHARLIDVQNGILLVEVDHPGWLQMLQLRKAPLLEAARQTAPLASIEGQSRCGWVRALHRASIDH